jgi:hypothetical protein
MFLPFPLNAISAPKEEKMKKLIYSKASHFFSLYLSPLKFVLFCFVLFAYNLFVSFRRNFSASEKVRFLDVNKKMRRKKMKNGFGRVAGLLLVQCTKTGVNMLPK